MAKAVSRVRIPYSPLNEWSVGQAVKTPPFHGGNTGSIPVRIIEAFLGMLFFIFKNNEVDISYMSSD